MLLFVDPVYVGKLDRPNALKVFCALWEMWLVKPEEWIRVDKERMSQLGLCRQVLNQSFLWLERRGFIRRREWDWREVAINPIVARVATMKSKEVGLEMLKFRPILPLLPDRKKPSEEG